MTTEKKPKLAYTITDQAALRATYPSLFKDEVVTVTKTTIDRPTLYALVKLQHKMGQTVPGVTVGEPVDAGIPAHIAAEPKDV